MKRITIVLLSVLLVASLFVSCKVEVDDPMADLVSIRFTDDDGSKGLNVSVPGLDEYTWYYKANKNSADGTGLKTGATGEDFVIIGGETGSGKLSEKAGPFSQGLWDFELQARNGESIVYTGKVSTVSVNKETTTVKVVVEPSQTGENGYLVIPKNIPLYDATNNVATNYKMVVSITNLISGKTVDVANVSTDNNYEKYSLEPASYRVSLTYQSEEGTYIYGSSETVVTIYSNMTTTLGGSVDENTSNVTFGPDGTIVVAPTEITTNNGVKEVTVTGSPADETKTTTVNFGDASGSITDGAKLSATMYPRQAAAKGFSVTDGNGVVLAGIDLKVVDSDGKVVDSNFGTNAVTVSTYIGMDYNINDLKVFYTDGTEHEIVSYVDGVLTFKTTHFSSFYVVNTAVVAINETQNTLYMTLEEAFSSAKDDDKIVLQKDVVLSKTIGITDGRTITLDLNGFCVDLNSKIFFLRANGENKGGSLNIEGKGKIRNTSAFVFVIFGATDSEGYSCKLSIGKDVDIEGTYAISIYSAGDNSCYNVNVDVYGRISGEQPIYVDGNIKNSNKAVQLNIHDNARVVCSDGSGIYLAGYAKTSIGEAKIESDGNAISIAAGELEVNGATIEGGSAEGFNAGSGGSISTKEASAIYAKQHGTNLPLKVVVNSGSFSAYIPLYQDKGQKGDSAAPEKVKIEIKGGEFKCNSEIEGSVSVKSEDKTGFITGGTFNSNPSKYVADGYVVVEDGDKYVVRKLKDGEEVINDAEGFKNAVVNGGTYILSENISLDEVVNVSSTDKVVLNLNGKTVDLNGYQDSLPAGVSGGILISKGSSLEIEGNGIIKNSKGMFGNEGSLIIRNGSYLVSDYATIIRNSGKVEISDGLFDSKYPVLFMYGNSEQIINGGTFNSGNYYTVYVNGKNKAATPVSLTINGGVFNEFLYLAGYSKTTITGGRFYSPSNNPIHVKAGIITIKGGYFNCPNANAVLPYDYFYWGNGSVELMGDVSIEACDYGDANPSVFVEGGTFVNGLHYYQNPELKFALGEVSIKEGLPNAMIHKDFSYSKKVILSYYVGSELKTNSAMAYFYSEEKADAFTMETVIEGITLVSVGEKVVLTK